MADELIYHYTDSATMPLICQNKRLWLCSGYEMNDSEELLRAASVLKSVSEHNRDVPEILIKNALMILEREERIYICCFSKNGDVLSQWRGYGSDGSGYSIGFSRAELKTPAFDSDKYYSSGSSCDFLIDCIYERQEAFFARILAESSVKYKTEDPKEKAIAFMLGAMIFPKLAMKNPGFSEEAEVRLVRKHNAAFSVMGTPEDGTKFIKFRASKQMLTSYFETDVQPSAFREIVLGPKNRSREDQVRLLLKCYGLGHVDVRRSELTYR